MTGADGTMMRRCLELARRGEGRVHPNPMVGAVVVRRGAVAGEGWHGRFGGPHAEVVALKQAGKRADGATMYVSLEPCDHHGKTPPCTEAIIAAGVCEVVIAGVDPNPLVAGRGIRRLRSAGIRVRTGILRKDAEALNEPFFHFHRTGLPFVGVKWAQTLDGRSADRRGRSKWITSGPARAEGHRLRSMYDAVVVGAGTIVADDPQLTVRAVKGHDPARVILDGKLRLSGTERVFHHPTGRTLVLTSAANLRRPSSAVRRMLRAGVELIGFDGRSEVPVREVLRFLGGEGFTSLLVEGGPRTVSAFVDSGLVCKVHAFVEASLFGGGSMALELPTGLTVDRPLRIDRPTFRPIGDSTMLLEGGLLRS